jgi:hypothetical protein
MARAIIPLCLVWRTAAHSRPVFNESIARLFASTAQAAYCGDAEETKQQLLDWTCEPCKSNGVSVVPGSMRLINAPEMGQVNSTFIYVVRFSHPSHSFDNSKQGCLVVYRGSETVTNWLHNFDIMKTLANDSACPGCRVHDGFWRLTESSMPEVLRNLNEIGCVPGRAEEEEELEATSEDGPLPDTSSLYVTGHSLGAALSQIAMYMLMDRGYYVRQAYNFESPRVGNAAWAVNFDNKFSNKIPYFRVTSGEDPIVHTPPTFYPFNYVHTNYEAYIDKAGHIVQCPHTEDKNCADRYGLETICGVWYPWQDTLEAHVHQCVDKATERHCLNKFAHGGNICHCPVASSADTVV